MLGVGTEPSFAIGQRALLIQTGALPVCRAQAVFPNRADHMATTEAQSAGCNAELASEIGS